MKTTALALSAIVLTASGLAHAETYWVSPDGAAAWADCAGTTPLDGASACPLGTANAEAIAGDTVYLRAGSYAGETIEPASSGTAEDNRIVFAGHDGEDVVIRDSAYGFYLYKQSYITIEHIDFVSLRRFFRIYSGHYNVVSHCDFDTRSPDSGDWAGAIIADDPDDDTAASEDSTHNWVHHCTFHRWAWGAFDEHRGALLNIGTDQSAGDDSSYNLVEDNTFAYGGHHTIGVYANYNVIRNNYIHNETNPAGWDFEGYRGAITEGPSAGRCLYEGNRFGFSLGSGMALRSPNNIFRFNTFYHHGAGGIQVVSNQAGIDHADENYLYHNSFFHNGHVEDYAGFSGGMYFSSWSGQSPVGNVIKNNIFHDNASGSVTYDGSVDPQIIESNWDEQGDPLFVDDQTTADPMTSPPGLPDLHLQEASPCIDQGAFLTTVVSADGSGTSFQVEDATYFMDGWGIIAPDQIQLDGDSESAAIVAIDYGTETLTVDRSLDWTQGQGVSLAFADTAPDLGAYEYGMSERCSEQGGSCCSADEQCVGGDYVEALDCGSRCCVGGTCEPDPGTGGSGGSGGSGGQGGAGASGAAAPGASPSDDDGGCGCRLARQHERAPGTPVLAWLAGVLLLGWRRRTT